MRDVIIIGAGPAGTCAAHDLAAAGFDVVVYDRRQELGSPKRCGEGLEKKAEDLIGKIPSRCIAQKIKGGRIYPPNGKYLDAIVEGGGYVLERKVFDKWLATRAAKAGAHIQADTTIISLVMEGRSVKGIKGEFLGDAFEERAKVIVAAVGAESPLPRQAGIDTQCNLRLVDTCLQYEMAGVAYDPNFIHIFLGNKIANRGYAWIFPKGNGTANVGIGIVPGVESPKHHLDNFIKSHEGLKDASIIEVNAGAVPVGGLLKDMVSNGFLVCGEAAHHVNPIHGGGIKEAIISGQTAAEVIASCLKKMDVSKRSLSAFNKKWWEKRGNHLAKVEKVREIMENLSDDDMNKIAASVKPEDVVEFTRGSRLSLLAKILMRNPSLVALARHLL